LGCGRNYITIEAETDSVKRPTRHACIHIVCECIIIIANNNNSSYLLCFTQHLKLFTWNGGKFSQHHLCVWSIHLDDATAAILGQNTHHTPAYWWRGDKVMKPMSIYGDRATD